MSDLPLTPDDVAEIVAILDSGTFDRLEIRTDRFALKVAREGPGEISGWTQSWDWVATEAALPLAAAKTEAADDSDHRAVRATLPGTFYRAPQPGAPPFVGVGDTVELGSVIGIIETMKLMNPVPSDVAGVVEAILVDDGTMIDAGTVLMRIRTGDA